MYAEPAALFDEVAGVVFFVNHDGDARRGVVKRAHHEADMTLVMPPCCAEIITVGPWLMRR